MPALVDTKVPAKSLRSNDIILFTPGDSPSMVIPAKVVKVEMKTRWTYVTLEDDITTRYLNDELVDVRRSQTTNAEITDSMKRAAARWARSCIADAEDNVTHAREKLIDELDYHPSLHRRHYVDYVIAQTEAAIWKTVVRYTKHDDVSIIDALHEVRDELTDELVNVRHESRSTSDSANLIDNIERDAKAAWLRTLKYKLPLRGDTRWMI